MCTKIDKFSNPKQIFEVSKDILEKTFDCRDKNCLCNEAIMCEVECHVSEKIVFVCPNKQAENCRYHTSFGGENFCKCQTRIEIYRKYKK